MERSDSQVVTLFWDAGSLDGGASVEVTGDPAHHAHVRRVKPGDALRLLDGAGRIAHGVATAVKKSALTVSLQRVTNVPRPVPLEVLVPVADRDRMLLAAEKCAELQVTSWRPVHFARSRSVSPRGEGPKFREKVLARMRSALEQSGAAWLPMILDESAATDALRSAATASRRVLLDMSGAPLARLVTSVPMIVAVGPEGGLEDAERAVAADSGWTFASLGMTTLRFETAVIAAAAVIRATQLTSRSS